MEDIQYLPFEREKSFEDAVVYSPIVWARGAYMYGEDWAGQRIDPDSHWMSSPVVNGVLGRLRRKGLLERYEPTPENHREEYESWGCWLLTPLGRDVLGLHSSDTVVV